MFITASLLPGPAFLAAYNIFNVHLDFALNRSNVSIVAATFSFTMLGFLIAIFTVFIGINERITFEKYRNNGYLDIFIKLYEIAIFCLVVTFCLALASFAQKIPKIVFDIMIASLINNLTQTILLTIPVINIVRRSHSNEVN